jgi:ATP-binding protein involved in chromosome partitioning
MVSEVSTLGDQGRLGEAFLGDRVVGGSRGLEEVRSVMKKVAERVWKGL